ncbi:hypothetical protein 3 [Hubei picorna-like virus 81]|uniref:Genome polyprotein n=1 Tax=Hubei picorna-like virus 81 TaxID=1923166 RepID=A0A1L3KKT0_9VIRU|nr:hypothetical protein 3 [Hubei picorna-like virus 81]APG77984.1 hypothetical protein 3 [Hubei picorna-like virus 81]
MGPVIALILFMMSQFRKSTHCPSFISWHTCIAPIKSRVEPKVMTLERLEAWARNLSVEFTPNTKSCTLLQLACALTYLKNMEDKSKRPRLYDFKVYVHTRELNLDYASSEVRDAFILDAFENTTLFKRPIHLPWTHNVPLGKWSPSTEDLFFRLSQIKDRLITTQEIYEEFVNIEEISAMGYPLPKQKYPGSWHNYEYRNFAFVQLAVDPTPRGPTLAEYLGEMPGFFMIDFDTVHTCNKTDGSVEEMIESFGLYVTLPKSFGRTYKATSTGDVPKLWDEAPDKRAYLMEFTRVLLMLPKILEKEDFRKLTYRKILQIFAMNCFTAVYTPDRDEAVYILAPHLVHRNIDELVWFIKQLSKRGERIMELYCTVLRCMRWATYDKDEGFPSVESNEYLQCKNTLFKELTNMFMCKYLKVHTGREGRASWFSFNMDRYKLRAIAIAAVKGVSFVDVTNTSIDYKSKFELWFNNKHYRKTLGRMLEGPLVCKAGGDESSSSQSSEFQPAQNVSETQYDLLADVMKLEKNNRELLDKVAKLQQERDELASAQKPGIMDSMAQRLTTPLAIPIVEAIEKVGERIVEQKPSNLDATLIETQELIAKLSDKFLSKSDPAMEGIFSSINVIFESLKKFLPSFVTISELNEVSASDVFYFVCLYIAYVNVESKSLKMLIVYLAMQKLGLVDIVLKKLNTLWEFVWSEGDDVSESETPIEPKAITDYLYQFMDNTKEFLMSHKKLIGFGIAALVFIVTGKYVMSKKDVCTAGDKVINTCRNFGAVGLAAVGVSRIMEVFQVVLETATEYLPNPKYDPAYSAENIGNMATMATVLQDPKVMKACLHTPDFPTTIRNMFRTAIAAKQYYTTHEIKPQLSAVLNNMVTHLLNAVKVATHYDEASKPRPAPFHVQLAGAPGIGKSSVLPQIVNTLGEAMGIAPTKPIYTRNTANELWDNFSSDVEKMIYDDLFAICNAEEVAEMMLVFSNAVYLPHIAEMSEKGTPFRVRVVGSATNVPYPEVPELVAPQALYRRRHVLAHTECDPRVLDPNTKAFSQELFEKFYPHKNSKDFPHLKFQIWSPTKKMTAFTGEPIMETKLSYEEFVVHCLNALQEASRCNAQLGLYSAQSSSNAELQALLQNDVFSKTKVVSHSVVPPLPKVNVAPDEREKVMSVLQPILDGKNAVYERLSAGEQVEQPEVSHLQIPSRYTSVLKLLQENIKDKQMTVIHLNDDCCLPNYEDSCDEVEAKPMKYVISLSKDKTLVEEGNKVHVTLDKRFMSALRRCENGWLLDTSVWNHEFKKIYDSMSVRNAYQKEFERWIFTSGWFVRSWMAWTELRQEVRLALMKKVNGDSHCLTGVWKTFVNLWNRTYDIMSRACAWIGRGIKWFWQMLVRYKKVLLTIGVTVSLVAFFKVVGSWMNGIKGKSKDFFGSNYVTGKIVPRAASANTDRIEVIRKNIIAIRIPLENAVEEKFFHGLGLFGQLFVLNQHSLRMAGVLVSKIKTFKMFYRRGLDYWRSVTITPAMCYLVPGKDLVFINCRDMPFYRDIRPHMQLASDYGRFNYDTVVLPSTTDDFNKKSPEWLLFSMKMTGFVPRMMEDIPNLDARNDKFYQLQGGVPGGTSGSPCIGVGGTQGRDLMGILSCGTNATTFVSFLSTEEVARADAHFRAAGNHVIVHQGTEIPIMNEQPDTILCKSIQLPIVGKAPINYVPFQTRKTVYKKTILAQEFPSEREPAVLNLMDPRLKIKPTHPLAHHISNFEEHEYEPLNNYGDWAARDITAEIAPNVQIRLKNLTFEETLLGDGNVLPLNLKTSPGIPWIFQGRTGGGKRPWIIKTPENVLVSVDKGLADQFKHMDDLIQQGVIPAHTMYFHAKDELRPKEKVEQGKTRAIVCVNMAYNMCLRKYFGPFFSVMHKMSDGFHPCMVGINPESITSHIMATRLKNWNNCFALDLSKFDSHVTREQFLLCARIVNKIMNDGCDLARVTLLLGVAHAYVLGDDALFETQKGMKSGAAIVAEINTLVHWIVFLAMYYQICHESGRAEMATYQAFKRNVTLFLYGDDMICSINPDMTWMTKEALIAMYKKKGWDASDASLKASTTAMQDAITHKNKFEYQTFLKRTFRTCYELGGIMVMAIDKSVINDLLHWQRETDNDEDQFEINVGLALQFAWFHGREYFESVRSRILRVCQVEAAECTGFDQLTMMMQERYFPSTIASHYVGPPIDEV